MIPEGRVFELDGTWGYRGSDLGINEQDSALSCKPIEIHPMFKKNTTYVNRHPS